jgi:hypothetical protein
MVCVLVPLLLKRKVDVLFGVVRGSSGDTPIFLACYGSVLCCLVVSILPCVEAHSYSIT